MPGQPLASVTPVLAAPMLMPTALPALEDATPRTKRMKLDPAAATATATPGTGSKPRRPKADAARDAKVRYQPHSIMNNALGSQVLSDDCLFVRRGMQARRVKQLRAAAAAEGSAAAAMVASPVAVDKSPRRSPRLNSPRTAAAKAAASKTDGACTIH